MIIVVLLITGCSDQEAPDSFVPGAEFPDFPLEPLWREQAPMSIGDYQGRLLILNIWAPWCAPCIEEMPRLNRLSQRLDGARFAVVGLTLDDRFLAQEFLRKRKIRFSNYFDAGGKQIKEILRVERFPATFLVDPDGMLLARIDGWQPWDSDENRKALEELYPRHAKKPGSTP